MNSWDAGLAGLLAGTMGVSLLSNALVLLCLLHSADIRRQAPALFTLNLTCGNLLCTVVNMPLTLAGVVAQRQPAGDRLCRLVAFLDTFLATNSMLSMAALSIDRWVAVVFPLSYRAKMRLRDAALMVAYTWLHALTFPATALALSWLGFHQLYASCTLCSRRPDERLRFAVFTGAFHALSFLLSFVVLCCSYVKVLKVARFHCKRIDVITMQTLVLLVDIHPSVRERCLEEQKRRRQRAAKKVGTFVGTFLLCFAPYVITSGGRGPSAQREQPRHPGGSACPTPSDSPVSSLARPGTSLHVGPRSARVRVPSESVKFALSFQHDGGRRMGPGPTELPFLRSSCWRVTQTSH